jgi:hypothetical protein
MVTEKQLVYVTDFIAQAYENLRLITLLETEEERELAMSLGDFTIMGHKAAFFVSDDAAKAINDFTSTWTEATLGYNDPEPTKPRSYWFGFVLEELEKLTALLRSEVGVYRRKGLRLPWKREQNALKPGS